MPAADPRLLGRLVVVSPHLDDAVLSLGATLAHAVESGATVEVLTVFAGIALFVVTLFKLFFHDLAQLDQLYRIGAFIAVALLLMGASYLYQRFLAVDERSG